jgi:hypothetical protein
MRQTTVGLTENRQLVANHADVNCGSHRDQATWLHTVAGDEMAVAAVVQQGRIS